MMPAIIWFADWSSFYLFCFAFGFIFSLFAFLSGHLHLPGEHGGHHGPVHLHEGPLNDAHGPHCDTPHPPIRVAGGSRVGAPAAPHAALRAAVSPFNAGMIAAFLAWFGGTGYLGARYTALWVYTTLALALFAGLFGAWMIFLFLTRVLMREREDLDAADYHMIGVLGSVSGAIRAGGLGEILYSQAGTRRAVPARCEDASATIPGGTEVVVIRYEHGIAYVCRWEDFLQENNGLMHQ